MISKRGKNRSGAVMVESVIVLPSILLLLVCIIQLAVTFSESLQLNYAAYQASRASFASENSDLSALVTNTITPIMPAATIKDDSVRLVPKENSPGLYFMVIDLEYVSPLLCRVLALPYNKHGDTAFDEDGIRLVSRGFYPFIEPEP